MPEELEDEVIGADKPPKLDYHDLLIEEEPREGEEDSGGYDPSASITSALDGVQHKSDVQAVLSSLTPRFGNKRLDDLLAPVMVTRIQPDNVLDSSKNTVLSVFEEQEFATMEEEAEFDLWGVISAVHSAHMIGFKGMGIADRLEAAGAVREEEIAKLSNGLGL